MFCFFTSTYFSSPFVSALSQFVFCFVLRFFFRCIAAIKFKKSYCFSWNVSSPDMFMFCVNKMCFNERIFGDTGKWVNMGLYRVQSEVLLDPCRTWCPSSTCQAVCQLKEVDPPALPQLVQCAVCALEFCSGCKANWHPGQACQESSLPITSFLPGENRYGQCHSRLHIHTVTHQWYTMFKGFYIFNYLKPKE